jgi:UDP-N-acetylmuramoylalanine--D-glutamate ligase
MNRLKNYINGRRVGILGLGVSNLPLAERLCDMGITITVYDKKSTAELGEGALSLAERGVKFVSGTDCFANIEEEVIFRSPGLRPDLPAIKEAVARGAELTSEIELLLEFCPCDTYAITGSDGKTTTTTLTGKFLEREAQKNKSTVYVGGNIGTPLLTRCEDMTSSDNVVLELSSFQLMTVKRAPMHVAITNVTPNHLDWHGEMGEYIAAKKNIIGKETRRVVVNSDNEVTRSIGIEAYEKGKEVIFFSSSAKDVSEALPAECRGCAAVMICDGDICITDGEKCEKLLSVKDIKVPGKHNVENFMTAIALTYGKVSAECYREVAESFFGVEHRLEFVRRLEGIDYYNSSIDSSPTRTAAALSALGDRDIIIICGGYDKKIPYEPLAEHLFRRAKAVVLTGATAGKISDAMDKYAEEHKSLAMPKRVHESDFRAAVEQGRRLALEIGKNNPCVLLSPASASFDSFKNFAERGNYFKDIVNQL